MQRTTQRRERPREENDPKNDTGTQAVAENDPEKRTGAENERTNGKRTTQRMTQIHDTIP